jgi:hypothetical protein
MEKSEAKQIINDFLKGTPFWLKSMKDMEELTHHKMCYICGIKPIEMKKLAKAINLLLK